MMIYQHPLAYVLGMEGYALLRAWSGEFDEAYVKARLAEIRQLLDEPQLVGHPGVSVARGTSEVGYQQYSRTYDEPGNGLFDVDEPFFHEILDHVPAGVALDAACGTGRIAAYLVEQGHQVVGVDSSPDMLDVARGRVPLAKFLLGELQELPVADESIDIVTCALALAHLPGLGRAMGEFARVLRPGGHLVISDAHRDLVFRGVIVPSMGPDGEPGLVPTFLYSAGDYLRAGLSAGLIARRCEEPSIEPGGTEADHEEYSPPVPGQMDPGPWENWPFTLQWLIPDVDHSLTGSVAILWHFQRPES